MLLSVPSLPTVLAFTTVDRVIGTGATYSADDSVGSDPSSVNRIAAPLVAVEIATLSSAPKTPGRGLNCGDAMRHREPASATLSGESRSTVVPSPSWEWSFCPHDHSARSAEIAKLELAPAATATMPASPGTRTGAERFSAVPSPSCP
jgi:hypothetical protein